MEFWFSEFHTPDVKHSIRVNKQLYSKQSDYQRIDIFETPEFGRVLTLDGNVMLTERDEFIYDEMIVHVPMAVHREAKDILVIGAGDGGVVRELTRYDRVERIDLVEMDPQVVEACRAYLPGNACRMDDRRVHIYFENALKFIRQCEEEYDLIIVDEASMLTATVFHDILSYSIPVIFVGDPGQLPPVEDKPVDILHTTPFVLTDVMRQALENPIVQWATMVRNGKDLPWTKVPWAKDAKCIRIRMNSVPGRSMLKGFADDAMSGKTGILCCKNSLRVKLNGLVRSASGFLRKLPQAGERLMCLRNMKGFGLYNGSTYTVSRIEECANDSCYKVWLDEREYPIVAWAGCLNCADSMEMGRRLKISGADIRICLFEETSTQEEAAMFDFGYASTVHKAQGSEWDTVLFYDDHSQKMTASEYRRWLYTGITRAKNELCILA